MARWCCPCSVRRTPGAVRPWSYWAGTGLGWCPAGLRVHHAYWGRSRQPRAIFGGTEVLQHARAALRQDRQGTLSTTYAWRACAWEGRSLKAGQVPQHRAISVRTWSWWDCSMAWALLLTELAHSTGSLVQAASLSQPSSLSASMGETVQINCSEGNPKRYFAWFQQKVPGIAPVTVIYADDKRPSGIPSRFSGSASGSTATLTITGVQAEDEAVYFCGGQDSSGTGVEGTKRN
uniref:Ig-like domain-containing protein n=1 Tax=Cyanistes caeruleus TaxID=156563 RepID=A0A8C0VLR4_CYACU